MSANIKLDFRTEMLIDISEKCVSECVFNTITYFTRLQLSNFQDFLQHVIGEFIG